MAVTAAPQGPPGQPEIAYTPNRETYLARSQRRLKTEKLADTLPKGFPRELKSELVWKGDTVSDTYDWSYELNDAEKEEVHQALLHFQGVPASQPMDLVNGSKILINLGLKKPLGLISQETFPLPSLHAVLRSISRELHNGHGFKVIRGVPVTKYTREENIIIYAGIASHVASDRGRQDHFFDNKPADVVLSHVKDLSATEPAKNIGSPAYTAVKQVFHTDVGDIVALLALETSAEGGESYLSSSWQVYNEIAATRPDLIRTLSEDWDFDE